MKTLITIALITLSFAVHADKYDDPVNDVYNGIYDGSNPNAQLVRAQRDQARAIDRQTEQMKMDSISREMDDHAREYKNELDSVTNRR